MAAPQYVNPLYQAILDAYGIEDDTKPTANIELAKVWEDFSEDVTRYRRDINADALKSRIADVRARLDYIRSSRDYQAKLEETAGRNARETAKAYVTRMNNLTTSKTRLATQRSQFYDQAFSPAQSAFEENEATGASASAETLFKTLDDRGLRYDAGNPDTAGLATQWAKMVLKQPDLSKVDPAAAAKAVKDAGGSRELQEKTARFIRDAQSADAAVRSANTDIKNAEDLAEKISASHGQITEETKAQALAAARKATVAFQYLVGQDPETLKSQEEELAAQDSRLQMMQERETRLYNRAFGAGGEGLRTRMGRVMANPEFQRWAADNGYELGQSQIDADGNVSYVPGPQDERALLRFAEQARTGRQGGLFERRRTDELVRVTITNPEERQRLLEANDLGGGRYAVDPQTGSLISSQAYIEESRKAGLVPQGYKAATKEGVRYVKDSSGQVFALVGGQFEPVQNVPAGLDFKDAVVYGADDKPRYMTEEDLRTPPNPEDIGFAAQEDVAAIEKSSPYKVVTAEQLPNVGVQTFEGYRDKRNAKTIGEMGEGAFSINNGQYTFGKDAKYEVLVSDAEPVRGSERLARRAARELGALDTEGQLTREQVLAARPGERPEAPVPSEAPSALRVAAGGSQARQEALTRAGDTTPPPGVAPAAAPAAAAPPDDLFGGAGFKEVEGMAVPSALAPKPEAPAEEAEYVRTGNGAVYKVTPEGAQMIAPAAGAVLDTTPVRANTDKFEALINEDVEPVDAEAGRRLETSMATAKPIGRPTPEITAEGQVTRIDYGVRRPTLGQRVGEAVAGLVRRREKPEGEAPPALVSKGREDLPEAAPIGKEDDLFPSTKISLEGAPAPVTGGELPKPGEEPPPAVFYMGRAAAGAKGEGPTTLRVGNVTARRGVSPAGREERVPAGGGVAASNPSVTGTTFKEVGGVASQIPGSMVEEQVGVRYTPSRRAQLQKALDARRTEIEERKAAPAAAEGFLREMSTQLDTLRREAPRRVESELLYERGPKPADPFAEPTETELVASAESKQEAEDRRTARKEKLGKFLGTMAAAFGRKPGATAATMPTTPTNGAR